MSIVARILGCGSSSGVPRLAGGWGDCDPAEPKNRRRRSSLLVRRHGPAGTTTVLIDTGPDMRAQLLDAGADRVDGVLYTHEHADHTHGIDDLRAFALNARRRVDVWADAATSGKLHQSFGYAFATPPGSDYPAILTDHRAAHGDTIAVDGPGGAVAAQAFALVHGNIMSLGFRIGGIAYSPDVNDIPEASLPFLQGLDVWIVDALRPRPHPSHFSLDDALGWIARLKPKRAILTDLTSEMDYAALRRTLPPGVEPAFDGMEIEA
jgi:phosphoribosyl 1,2-cyclic phosphate phosphodiesterase